MGSRTVGGVTSTYTYGDGTHKNAVTQVGSLYYCYDSNGNLTKRNASNATCTGGGDTLTYDVENRLSSMTVGAITTTFFYDGDGTRVKKVVPGTGGATTYYVGPHLEIKTPNSGGAVWTYYYYFGGQRVAMKQGATVYYLRGDHPSTALRTSPGLRVGGAGQLRRIPLRRLSIHNSSTQMRPTIRWVRRGNNISKSKSAKPSVSSRSDCSMRYKNLSKNEALFHAKYPPCGFVRIPESARLAAARTGLVYRVGLPDSRR
jgi:hypothetical protein